MRHLSQASITDSPTLTQKSTVSGILGWPCDEVLIFHGSVVPASVGNVMIELLPQSSCRNKKQHLLLVYYLLLQKDGNIGSTTRWKDYIHYYY